MRYGFCIPRLMSAYFCTLDSRCEKSPNMTIADLLAFPCLCLRVDSDLRRVESFECLGQRRCLQVDFYLRHLKSFVCLGERRGAVEISCLTIVCDNPIACLYLIDQIRSTTRNRIRTSSVFEPYPFFSSVRHICNCTKSKMQV